MGEMSLQTIEQVADRLGVCVRLVRDLPIPIVRIARKRLYDPRDVTRYIEASKCLSSKDQARRSTTRRLSSEDVGLSEALAQAPVETQSSTNARSEISLRKKPRPPRQRRRGPSIRLVANTGSKTAGD